MENYHLTKIGGGWHLIKEGADRAWKNFPTKEIGVTESSQFLEGKMASLKIHREDGTIEEERTYPRSADPTKTPG